MNPLEPRPLEPPLNPLEPRPLEPGPLNPLASPGAEQAPPAWMKHIGGLDPETADELRRNLEEADFSRVDPADTASASRGAGARTGEAA